VFYTQDKPGRFINAADLAEKPDVGAFGAALVAADFNGDHIPDLAVGAPGTAAEQRDHARGSVYVLFGGPHGLSAAHAVRISDAAYEVGFGSRLAAGDVDNDGKVDLVEGAPYTVGDGGHMSYCPGGRPAPPRCVDVSDTSASALAVGDINGDRVPDVVAGDAGYKNAVGAIRVWLGGSKGLAGQPTVIGQRVGKPEADDEFGSDVAIGSVTGDRWGDIVVAARGDEGGQGTVTVVPGSASGANPAGSQFVNRPALPTGARFGAALSLLDYDNDHLPEIIVAASNVTNLDDALWVYVSHAGEGFDARADHARGLGTVATSTGDGPLYIGR